MLRMKASDYIAEFLRVQKTTHVFEVAGGMITHILDSLYRFGHMNIISIHHEQAGAFAADAYGRCLGRPGVALATSGPGATNLLTGIGSCYFDSSPAMFMTGQVNTYEQKGSRLIRQLGFQETDIVSMARPITKKCFLVEKAEDLEAVMQEAYALTMHGRPGPVLVDIPMNIQRAEIDVAPIKYIPGGGSRLSRKKVHAAAAVPVVGEVRAQREINIADMQVANVQIGAAEETDACALDSAVIAGNVVMKQSRNVAELHVIQPTPALTATLNTLCTAIQQAKRPLILAGQGISCARATQAFLSFVEAIHVPVVTSLLALDVIPYHHRLRVGMIGSYGNRWANLALGTADLLIVIGSRLDIRQTGSHIEGFRGDKTIFHIDCDESEINNRITNCIPIVMDANDFLTVAMQQFSTQSFQPQQPWLEEIDTLKSKWPDLKELSDFSGINPNHFMHVLSRVAKEYLAYVVDVGNHQMWAGQSLELTLQQAFITSGGMGAMGFALPAAIGYSFALEKKPVIVIAGDGALQMNIQELQTIIRNKLPIKIVVINNQALGMIRQFQDSYFEGRYQSTYWGYSAPNFVAIAEAYGLAAKTISDPNEIAAGAEWLCSDPHAPALLQVMISPHMNVYPKIAFGKPITEMEPFAVPNEMEST